LERLAEVLGVANQVHFLGALSLDRLKQELAQAQFFVSASEYEGFGISAVEGMASGTVCILNDIAAFRNIIEDGVNGFLVDYKSDEQVSIVLGKALALNAAEYTGIVTRAQEKAKTYSWHKVARIISRLYS
jgi:alpha-1,3-mannosyltransferase